MAKKCKCLSNLFPVPHDERCPLYTEKLSDNPKAIEAAANVLFDKPDGKYDNLKERMDDCRITAKQILQAAEKANEVE